MSYARVSAGYELVDGGIGGHQRNDHGSNESEFELHIEKQRPMKS